MRKCPICGKTVQDNENHKHKGIHKETREKPWTTVYKRSVSRVWKRKECEVCGTMEKLTIHHKIPLRRGGGVNEENCMTLCRTCHDKADKEDIYGNTKVRT